MGSASADPANPGWAVATGVAIVSFFFSPADAWGWKVGEFGGRKSGLISKNKREEAS